MQSVNRQVWGQNFIKGSHFSIKGFSNSHIYIPIFPSTRFQARIMLQNSYHKICSNVTTISLNLLYVFHCCYFLGIILVCMALSTKKRYVQCDPITIYTMPSSLWVNLLTMAGILQSKLNCILIWSFYVTAHSELLRPFMRLGISVRPEIIQVWNMQTLKFGVCFRGHCQESNCPVCCV